MDANHGAHRNASMHYAHRAFGTKEDPQVSMTTCPDGLETSSTLTHVCPIYAPAQLARASLISHLKRRRSLLIEGIWSVALDTTVVVFLSLFLELIIVFGTGFNCRQVWF